MLNLLQKPWWGESSALSTNEWYRLTSSHLHHLKGVFDSGSPVYARDYRAGHRNWTEGTIERRFDRVLYEVTAEGNTRIRHKNQLRTRHCRSSTSTQEHPLPLGVLLDTFNIPVVENEITNVNVELLPRRWFGRLRRAPASIQLETRSRRYR
ncbi:hypothetical protein FGIG_00335 [Fasciola gigantica]|uniref:Uncharacterized protein n=1 Tax=Fasciola gigantica TaxID=46835 RepID=A0A504YMS5_FASGI|nr:hypothetical protein FGIG_00335 [Fasciola gigantica]